MDELSLTGSDLTIDDIVRVARSEPGAIAIRIDETAYERVVASRTAVEQIVAEGRVVYGITTGFGAFKDRVIPGEKLEELQRNLVLSHSVGVGRSLESDAVRALILIRANQLTKGYSGVRPEVIELLLALLEHGIEPMIPEQGSLGTSGDLAPLAHLALVLIGEGKACVDGEAISGADALARAGLEPLTLKAKEGLALLNGTAAMSAIGSLVVYDAEQVAYGAEAAGAITLEAVSGIGQAFDERLQAVRPHPRQVETAGRMRALVAGSEFSRDPDPQHVQDAYSLRCIPQIHGAVRDAIAYARWVLEIEINSATDNPLIFVEEDGNDVSIDVLSGGNFHGEPVAIAMDYLTLALTELGNVSERRINRLVDPSCNEWQLPAFLTEEEGLNSGYMLAHYTAAALASENKVLAHPASADSIPTSANIEDHQSLGTIAARQARDVLVNTATIVGIELIAGAQAIDLRRKAAGRDLQLGAGTAPVYTLVREHIPYISHDRIMYDLIETARDLIYNGAVRTAAQTEVPGESVGEGRRGSE